MRSTVATDVPPNFMTRRGMDQDLADRRASRGGKARIHDGEGPGCQRGPKSTPTSRSSRMAEDASTIDPAEVARFARVAETWWDPRGPMRALHKFNPVR